MTVNDIKLRKVPHCCGVAEALCMNQGFTAEEILCDLMHKYENGTKAAHVVLTSVRHRKLQAAAPLKKLVHGKKLGSIVSGKASKNPNSNNIVVPHILTPDWPALLQWATDQPDYIARSANGWEFD